MHQIPSWNSSKRIIKTNKVLKPFELLLSYNSRIILHINVNINCSAVNYIEVFILSNVNVCWKVPSFLHHSHNFMDNTWQWVKRLPLAAISDGGLHGDVLLRSEKRPQRAVPHVDQRELMETCTCDKIRRQRFVRLTQEKEHVCFCLLEEQEREDGFCSNLRPLLWRSCIFWCGTEIQSRMVGFSVSGPQKLDPLDTSCSFCCCTTNSTNRIKKVWIHYSSF